MRIFIGHMTRGMLAWENQLYYNLSHSLKDLQSS